MNLYLKTNTHEIKTSKAHQVIDWIPVIITMMIIILTMMSVKISAETLNLESARQMALENSLLVKNAELETVSKSIDESQVINGWLPSISTNASIGSGYSYSQSGSEIVTSEINPSLGISLSQPIYKGGTYSLEKKSATAETSISRAEYDIIVLEVLNSIDNYFFEYLKSLTSLETAKSDVEAVSVLIEIAESRMEYGKISRSEYLNIMADASAKETTLHKAESNVTISKTQLASYIAIDADEIEETQDLDKPEYDKRIQRLSALTNQELSNITTQLALQGMKLSPEIIKAGLNRENTKLQAELSKKKDAPSVSLSVSEKLTCNEEFDLSNSGSLSLSASFSLSQWGRQGTVKQANIQIQQAENSNREAIRKYLLQIQNSWLELIASTRETVSSEASLEYSNELYKIVLEQYRQTTVSYSDLADAEARLTSSRQSFLNAKYMFYENTSDLCTLLGYTDWNKLWEILDK